MFGLMRRLSGVRGWGYELRRHQCGLVAAHFNLHIPPETPKSKAKNWSRTKRESSDEETDGGRNSISAALKLTASIIN